MLGGKETSARRSRLVVPVAVALASLVSLVPVAAHADTPTLVSPAIPTASGPVQDVGVGGALPSEATCAARVVSTAENRPQNNTANHTRGSANDENPRVTGNFVGTTDEIIQWAACKWGMDPTWARNQAAIESFWNQSAVGDNGESFGILQVRRPYHATAFENENAVRSTAYNADYAWSIWRRCFNGEFTWLNDVERGRQYAAGDGLGCMGAWFAGRWYTDDAVGYMNRLSTAGSGIPSPAPTPAKPSAPRSLTGFAGNGYVYLSWSAPSSTGGSPITDYVIQRSSNGGSTWTSLSDGVSTNRTYWATGLANGATYRFRVAARNAYGWGPVSNVVTATPHVSRPSAPRSLKATPGSGLVRLNWTAPSSSGGLPITDYVIQRSYNGGLTWTSLSDGVSTSRQYFATGLANGATYRFRVAARNAAGWSAFSAARSATPNGSGSLAVAAAAEPTTTTATAATSSTTTTTAAPGPSTSSGPTTAVVTSTTSAPTSSSPPTTIPPTTAVTTTVAPTTLAPTTEAPTTVAETTLPPPTEPSTTEAPPLPPVQAPSCAAVSADDVQRVNTALASAGLTIAVATAGDDGATRYIVGSIYDSAANRVSGPDTWVIVDGQLLALSGGANQYSTGLNDATGVVTPGQVHADLSTCATAALQGG